MPWNIFNDDLIPLLEHTLTWRSRRQEVIAGNVANLDTPHYTRNELNFHDILNTYIQGGPRVHLISTHPAHIQADSAKLAGAIQDTGQEVDVDREMVEMAANHLSYQASVQMLSKKLDSLRTVIEGDRR
jgi:flagellar basal-body rod protein FlgB